MAEGGIIARRDRAEPGDYFSVAEVAAPESAAKFGIGVGQPSRMGNGNFAVAESVLKAGGEKTLDNFECL